MTTTTTEGKKFSRSPPTARVDLSKRRKRWWVWLYGFGRWWVWLCRFGCWFCLIWSVGFSGYWVCWDRWVWLVILVAVIGGDWRRCCWRWVFDCCCYGGGETKRTQAREIREDREEERERVRRREMNKKWKINRMN